MISAIFLGGPLLGDVAALAATACGLVSCRAQFRGWPSLQAWNVATALAYVAVALIAAVESDWFGFALAVFVAVLRWLLWKRWRRDASWSG